MVFLRIPSRDKRPGTLWPDLQEYYKCFTKFTVFKLRNYTTLCADRCVLFKILQQHENFMYMYNETILPSVQLFNYQVNYQILK